LGVSGGGKRWPTETWSWRGYARQVKSYYGQVELAMSPDEAIHRFYGILCSLPRASPPCVEGASVWTNIGPSIWSWGETVGAHIEPRPGRCLITVRSTSTFAFIDWGVNKRNVDTVLNRVIQQYEIDRMNAALAAANSENLLLRRQLTYGDGPTG
jgi:uncharacterized protein (DUF1499 family)